MSDKAEVFTIPWKIIEAVVYSQEEFDGTLFDTDADGTTRIYSYGDMWGLNLFLLALAQTLGSVIEPELMGFEQTYQSFAALTAEMSMPIPAPHLGEDYFVCRMPCLRITGLPVHN